MISDDELALLELAPIECVKEKRKELIDIRNKMVGSLYPSIVSKDIDRLDIILKKRGYII